MINIKFLLGLYPSTSKIEEKEKALIEEYQALKAFEKSDELNHFLELKAFVESPEFEQKKQEIENLDFKKTDAYQKEQEYFSLKKSKRIVIYYKVLNSELYQNYLQVKDSDDLKNYIQLKAFIESDDFKNKWNNLKALNFKDSELHKLEEEYNSLKKSELIKNYFKVIGSAEFKNYQELEGSEILQTFQRLQSIFETEEFKKLKENIANEKFENTPEYALLAEYTQLKKSDHIKTYFKVVRSEKYSIYKSLDGSSDLTHYTELEAYIQSPEFIELKKDKKAFHESEAFTKEQEFNRLKKDKRYKIYFKFISSPEFELFKKALSGDVDRLTSLEEQVNSPAFIEVQSYYKLSADQRFRKHELYSKWEEYQQLKKDKRIIDYFKFIESKAFTLYQQAISEGIVDKYEKLKNQIESEDFQQQKQYLLLPFEKKWQQTDEYIKEQEFKKLANDERIKKYLKFIETEEFKLFDEVDKSGEVDHYETLEKYILSDEFKSYKQYMLLPFKEKWQQTDEYQKEQEFNQLSNSEKIKWYFKIKDSDKFDEIKAWDLTFYDDFEKNELDKDKWLTRYYWGDATLHDAYSLSDDKHFNTDGNNLIIQNSILKIETRKEKVTGKAWTPMFGFMPKEFDYTSGLINTGKSFRQQYGRFRAKIRMSGNPYVTNAFYMVGNQVVPHIDIAKFVKFKLWFNTFWGNITEKDGINRLGNYLSTAKPIKNFYIYELRWTPTELVWYINGLEIYRTTKGIPNEPMYVQLSAGIMNEVKANHFPVCMEIDWVKCYTPSEKTNINTQQ